MAPHDLKNKTETWGRKLQAFRQRDGLGKNALVTGPCAEVNKLRTSKIGLSRGGQQRASVLNKAGRYVNLEEKVEEKRGRSPRA